MHLFTGQTSQNLRHYSNDSIGIAGISFYPKSLYPKKKKRKRIAYAITITKGEEDDDDDDDACV